MSVFDNFSFGGDFGENPAGNVVGALFPVASVGMSAFGSSPAGGVLAGSGRLLSEPSDVTGSDQSFATNEGIAGLGVGSLFATSSNNSAPANYNPPSVVNGVKGSWDIAGVTFTPDAIQDGRPINNLTKQPYVPSTLPKSQQYAAIKAQGAIDASNAFWKSFVDSISQNASSKGNSLLMIGVVIIGAIVLLKFKR